MILQTICVYVQYLLIIQKYHWFYYLIYLLRSRGDPVFGASEYGGSAPGGRARADGAGARAHAGRLPGAVQGGAGRAARGLPARQHRHMTYTFLIYITIM